MASDINDAPAVMNSRHPSAELQRAGALGPLARVRKNVTLGIGGPGRSGEQKGGERPREKDTVSHSVKFLPMSAQPPIAPLMRHAAARKNPGAFAPGLFPFNRLGCDQK